MHEALTGLLDTADLALAATREAIGEMESVARLINDARVRLDHPEDALVVALAGGTGSGKSSLFNALVGSEAAPVGRIRPTTSEPVAAIPGAYGSSFDGYLDLLGIATRVTHSHSGFCLIDLPDTDSVVVANRHRVERILPRIDVLVWVVDPEKYRDAALHHRYLRELAGYQSQFLFVLNQVDRLGPDDAAAVEADLAEALREDGITEPRIIRTSVPPDLPPTGVDDLLAALASLAGWPETLYRKLIIDLGQAATEMEAAIGKPVGYRDLMAPALDFAVACVLVGDRKGAVDSLTRLVDDVAGRVGGEPGRRIVRAGAALPEGVERVVAAFKEPRSLFRRRKAEPARYGEARREVEALLAPVTAVVTARARALAQVAELAVEAARLRSFVDT